MLTGKRVLVIGLARSGKAAVKLLQKLNATITINEGKPLEQIDGYQEYLDAGIEIVAGDTLMNFLKEILILLSKTQELIIINLLS
ncbi:MAG: hypothetical protein ACLR43_12050 [Faecalibacillus faecis]